MLESLTIATFADRVGDRFRVRFVPDELAEIELISVVDLGSDRTESTGTRRPFSLEFRDPGQRVFPQQTYRMEHADLAGFEIFLVPVGADELGVRYEAVFT